MLLPIERPLPIERRASPENPLTKQVLDFINNRQVVRLIKIKNKGDVILYACEDPLFNGRGTFFSGQETFDEANIDDNLLRRLATPNGMWWLMRTVSFVTCREDIESGKCISAPFGAIWPGKITVGTRRLR